ncbi:HAD-IB family hydrolase [Lysinibacillus telephonicus]|uniref:HAD family hydrolase n=1 Tax=Lysinibacillus telephonicus TaxID=1714840 RepID=UPI0031FD7839
MNKKIAFFDIDKTIIKKDSMFLFVWFGLKKRPRTFPVLLPIFFFTILYTLRLISSKRVKEYYFYSIKFLKEEDLHEFYLMLKKHIFIEAMEELQSRKNEGCYNLLVSASPYAYVKYFKEIPYVDDVIGTELVIKNDFYINRINGDNCKGEEKVRKIEKHLKQLGYVIDFNNSYAYSDSLSDLPMLALVRNSFIVNGKSKEEIKVVNWK